MTLQDINSSSTDSSSGSSSDSSSSGSSSSSSGSASSSSDSESTSSETPANAVPATAPKSPKQPASEDSQSNNKKAEEKSASKNAGSKASSSSEDDAPQSVTPKPVPGRRRSSAKPKTAATIQPKQGKPAPRSTEKPKPTPKTLKSDTANALKKKSIFSPDNSSESESEEKSKNSSTSTTKSQPPARGKGRPRKQSKEAPKASPAKKEEVSKDTNSKRRSDNSTSGPPPKKSIDEKQSASSCSTSQSSSDSDTVDSSSEPEPDKKQPELKTGKTRSNSIKSNSKSESTSKSANSDDSIAGSMPRKLTRSLSARVSRLAAKSRVTNTDTDSDTEDRVEKSLELKKGRRPPIKSPAPTLLTLPDPTDPKERKCPVRGCDSSGHLGGLSDTHYTWDACPVYHNVSPAWCVAASEERAAATTARQRAVQAMKDRPRSQPGIEHRAYQLKVKDMRSKWKGSQELRDKLAATGNEECDDREPILDGFVPDYDLRLFREAQALAAIKIEEELEDIPTDRGTKFVVMGKYLMEVWYQSPYPGSAARAPRLFICEYCLSHQQSAAGAARHKAKCVWLHPPGDEVYRKNNVSVWQVDGRKHKQYCQQLCLLAKFFLDHKTLYYDVEPFLFYVMTLADREGCHIVGYFSKEKNSFLNYNVSCILTLPPYQRQGYGRLLIDFSYLLTKVEGKVGSPETPLSDLGLISYRSYWKEALLKRLCSAHGASLCIRDLSKDLAIASCDIVSTLQERGLMKYWKGKHIVLKKQDVLEDASRRAERASCVDPACLRWSPPAAPPPR